MPATMLSRNSSSLSRSPTIHSCLDEEEAIDFSTRKNRTPRRLNGRYLRFRLLFPPLALTSIPCLWWYAQKTHLQPWSNFLAFSLFASAFTVSVKLIYPYRTLVYRVFAALVSNRAGGCGGGGLNSNSISSYLKPVFALLAEERGKKPGVIWTIGSRTKAETSKLAKEGIRVFANGAIWAMIGCRAESGTSKVAKEGVRVFGNGDVYEGEFHQGRSSGSGVYYFYMSGRYEGEWVDGKYEGYGVETWARGSRYRGQYRKGLREGYGVYRFYTGDVYAGEWSNGQSHGCGTQTCEDGSRYVGEFNCGVKHGFGYYFFRNGDTYAGEYFSDKMHGYGVYQFANGHRYEGAWHEGKRQGLGMYTFRNGDIQAGHWQTGALQIPSTQNSSVVTINAINHTKVLHVVQEARQAAEKAYRVPRMDDRVNRTVAAANRAANAARVAAAKAVQINLYGGQPSTTQ